MLDRPARRSVATAVKMKKNLTLVLDDHQDLQRLPTTYSARQIT